MSQLTFRPRLLLLSLLVPLRKSLLLLPMLLLLLLLPSLLALSEGGELGKVVSVCGSEGGEEGEFAGESGMSVRKKSVMRLDLFLSWADNLM